MRLFCRRASLARGRQLWQLCRRRQSRGERNEKFMPIVNSKRSYALAEPFFSPIFVHQRWLWLFILLQVAQSYECILFALWKCVPKIIIYTPHSSGKVFYAEDKKRRLPAASVGNAKWWRRACLITETSRWRIPRQSWQDVDARFLCLLCLFAFQKTPFIWKTNFLSGTQSLRGKNFLPVFSNEFYFIKVDGP